MLVTACPRREHDRCLSHVLGRRQRRHGEAKKGGAGRRRAAKPLSESGSLKSTGPPQAVKMVVHTPPVSPRNDAAAQTWAAPLSKTARSGT